MDLLIYLISAFQPFSEPLLGLEANLEKSKLILFGQAREIDSSANGLGCRFVLVCLWKIIIKRNLSILPTYFLTIHFSHRWLGD